MSSVNGKSHRVEDSEGLHQIELGLSCMGSTESAFGVRRGYGDGCAMSFSFATNFQFTQSKVWAVLH